MTERYTAAELARMSESDVVRRELDRANRRTLVVYLVVFAVVAFVSLLREAMLGPVPRVLIWTAFANIAINLLAAAAIRRTRRSITAWVVLFCVLQFLVAVADTVRWVFGAFIALLFARFRLSTVQSLALNVFFAAAVAALAQFDPLPSPSEHFSDREVSNMGVGVSLLQIAGTRRVKREIAEEWLELAAVSIPAAEVGGDYYDFFQDGDRPAIVACDVAGHGLQSGMVLAALRGGLITTMRRSMTVPAAVLDQLHDLVAHTSRRRMLAAAIVVLFDRGARRATIASAAHPPLILRRGRSTRLIEAFAPPLGIRLPFTSGRETLDLEPGDLFVIHSDGVYESRNDAGEEYGLDRLRHVVGAQPADATAAAVRDAIVADVERFRGRPQDDDVTVVVARVAPHATIGAAWT